MLKNAYFNLNIFEKGCDINDDKNDLGVKIDILYEYNKDSILQKYGKSDSGISRYSADHKSIYFCFVFSSIYFSDHSQSILSNDINKLKEKFPPNKRHFDYLYFFMDGKLYEITSSNELYVYSLPISNRLRQGIYNEMKKYYYLYL